MAVDALPPGTQNAVDELTLSAYSQLVYVARWNKSSTITNRQIEA